MSPQALNKPHRPLSPIFMYLIHPSILPSIHPSIHPSINQSTNLSMLSPPFFFFLPKHLGRREFFQALGEDGGAVQPVAVPGAWCAMIWGEWW